MPVIARDELLGRMARSIQGWQRALGRAAAGGAVLEVGRLVGSVVPAAPSRSILNAAAGPRGMTFTPALLRELAARYAEAGIAAWGVWIHEDETAACGALEAAGLTIDSRPTAMALDLAGLVPPPAPGTVSVAPVTDLAMLAEPLGAGYGFPPELLTRGLPGLLDSVEAWTGRVNDLPAAGAAIVRSEADAGVFMVATAPALRGRGAASTVLYHALARARESGCTTSTLQSSAMGRSVYARLGYVELGAYLLWEGRPDAEG